MSLSKISSWPSGRISSCHWFQTAYMKVPPGLASMPASPDRIIGLVFEPRPAVIQQIISPVSSSYPVWIQLPDIAVDGRPAVVQVERHSLAFSHGGVVAGLVDHEELGRIARSGHRRRAESSDGDAIVGQPVGADGRVELQAAGGRVARDPGW